MHDFILRIHDIFYGLLLLFVGGDNADPLFAEDYTFNLIAYIACCIMIILISATIFNAFLSVAKMAVRSFSDWGGD